MAYKSANPALKANTFNGLSKLEGSEAMTLSGVTNKSTILLLLLAGTGYAGWQAAGAISSSTILLLFGSLLIAFIIAMVTIFKKTAAPFTAPLYALAEGFALGVISRMYNDQYSGIVLQAIGLTIAIFFALLFIYKTRIIKVTENFKLGLFAATGGIALFYLVYFVLGLFGIQVPVVNDASAWGIGFSVFVVIIAALNLVVDFDFIEKGVEQQAPKYMEWYASFGLLVTLVWLYLEILRLLAKAKR